MAEPEFPDGEWRGHRERECGNHVWSGRRAWCPDCSTWCYPDSPCPGCEVPMLEARAKKAEEQRDDLLSAYKVWKDATLKRCKLLSSRESSDSMLFPDQAFIEAADRIAREVRDDG